LPQNVKDVLIDLTYRGDYTGTKDKRGNTRKVIVPAVYKDQVEGLKGETSNLNEVISNTDLWKSFGVDLNRRKKREAALK